MFIRLLPRFVHQGWKNSLSCSNLKQFLIEDILPYDLVVHHVSNKKVSLLNNVRHPDAEGAHDFLQYIILRASDSRLWMTRYMMIWKSPPVVRAV